jgi:putative oxidoreductase
MKKELLLECCIFLLLLLFTYTAISKFLDYGLFVFQMQRAPLPLMKSVAPILGWLMPTIEMLIVIGLLITRFRLKALCSSVILLTMFEIYITGMLLANQHLPCTCGGIISTMSWKQHLFFNAFFISIGIIAIIRVKKYKFPPAKTGQENIKDLSRA